MSDPSDYAREVETYLCRKNEGHLIRIVGPAFEQVCGWAAQGVPLAVTFRGIDRYCERYYAKGPRRRPVRIEFCEADVLEAFDDWRRAVGVPSSAADAEEPRSRKPPLAAHVERVVARLTSARGGTRSPAFHDAVDAAVRALDAIAGESREARGDRRAALLERLALVDAGLMAAAGREVGDARRAALRREAEAELAPFGNRMSPEARDKAVVAALERLTREALGLPVVRHE